MRIARLSRHLLSARPRPGLPSGLFAVLFALMAVLAVPVIPATAADSSDIWTQFTPSTDTRLVFVSSSEGSDTNSGLSPALPVKTLAKAETLLRDGMPDWMLLKRGDVWNDQMPRWEKSGRAESEKMVVGAYGDEEARPQIRPSGMNGLSCYGETAIRHVAFVGLHFEPRDRGDLESPTGISWLRPADDILFEDLYIRGFKDNVGIQRRSEGFMISNFRINGCVVVDAWGRESHSQGIYIKGTDNVIIENCVIDANGYNLDRGAEATTFNHDIYAQTDNNGLVVRNNIIANASSHGIHFRCGGVLKNNLFLSNPISVDLGGGTHPRDGGVEYDVTGNIIMHGRGISDNQPRGWGISIKNTLRGYIAQNILTDSIGPNAFAFRIADPADGTHGIGFRDLMIENNTVLGWNGSVVFVQPESDQVFENVIFKNNNIYRDMNINTKPIVDVQDGVESELQISGNVYRYIVSTGLPFRIGGAWADASEWMSDQEPNADIESVQNTHWALTIDGYMQSIGRSGGIDEFLEQARLQSRSVSNENFVAQRVYEWAEANLP